MSDVVVGVRLQADGSGFVGQLKLSRAELDALSASAKNTSAAFDAGRAAGQNYATMAARLHAALDPMYTVQQRFNQELNEAETLFKAGAISSRVYADAVRLANDNLRAGAAAVQASTGAAQQHTQALGAQRAGYQQLGFQMQDVFASYASGTRLSVIAAQQAGQFASAISLIGQASGESTTRFGRFANFMGGPWGIAIGVGVTALGALAAALTSGGREADKSGDKTYDFTRKLDLTALSADQAAEAMRQLEAATRSAIKTQGDFLASQAATADAAVADLEQRLAKAQAELQKINNENQRLGMFGTGYGIIPAFNAPRRSELQTEVSKLGSALADAKKSQASVAISRSEREVAMSRDAATAATIRYEVAVGKLNERLKATLADPLGGASLNDPLTEAAYRKELARLQDVRDAAIAAAKEQRKVQSGGGQVGREIDGSAARAIAMRQGWQVNSAKRPSWIKDEVPGGPTSQERLYQKWVAQGRPSDNPTAKPGTSAHERDGALDIQFGKGVTPQAIKQAFAAEGVTLTKPLKERGHYHIEWSTKGADKVQAEAERLAKFGEQAADKIGRINAEFDEQPRLIDRANAATATLNELIKGLSSEQPLGFEQLIADAEQAKIVIKESLNRPFEEFMAAQRESAEIDKLLLAGRYDEAEALKVVLRLQEQQGPLSEAQLKAVLATVEGARRLSMVMRDQRALIQANLDAVDDMRGALEQTVAGMLRGKLSAGAILSSIGNSYIQITSKRIVESMFGDTLRQLEEQATGQDKVRKASDGIAGALDDGSAAVKGFADVVRSVTGAIAPRPGVNLAPGGGAAGLSSSVFGAITNAVSGGGANNPAGGGPAEIVVVGSKPEAASSKDAGGAFIVDLVSEVTRAIGFELPTKLTDGLKGILGKLETSLAESFKGALLGSAASSLVLGKSGSNTGAMLGGAFGESVFKKAAPNLFKSLGDFGGPIGSIVGGLLGGLFGGLFSKAKTGGAAIGLDARGNAGVTGTGGNNAELKKQASGWGGTVANQLDRIAEALGADLGAFSVAIGQRKDEFRVSASGNVSATTAKKTGADIIYKGKDEGEALMAALGNAIADGAIAGVSAAVQKALRSSSDVEKALKEALKVQDVEIAIGGIGAELAKQFKDFERQAAERVRIAREYGFDLTKLEERNAQDRLKLTQSLMAEQVGSLQDLIEQMTGGSLFEGSAVDQRQVILDKIAAAKTAADAGDEGAADKLAALLEQLNAVSREAYGTTGNFASDRQTILDTARDTIARANQRIADAQRASDPALAATNAALNENNDQNASIIALLESIQNGMVARSYATGQIDYSQLANLARTSIY